MEEPQFNSRVPQPYNAPYPSQPYAPPGSIPNGPYMDSNYQAQEPKLCSLREVLEYFMTPIGIVKIVSVVGNNAHTQQYISFLETRCTQKQLKLKFMVQTHSDIWIYCPNLDCIWI